MTKKTKDKVISFLKEIRQGNLYFMLYQSQQIKLNELLHEMTGVGSNLPLQGK